jgi:CheY-like chemotaxis protein
MKLLIVEDNQQMRRLMRSMLADLAEPIMECSDGAEAQASYAEHHPDWVLMDLMMPWVDGITATERIRADDPSAKIIIVTDHESRAMRDAAREAGACGYVLKDDLSDLRQILTAAAC